MIYSDERKELQLLKVATEETVYAKSSKESSVDVARDYEINTHFDVLEQFKANVKTLESLQKKMH